MKQPKFLQSKRFQYGSAATIFTAVFLVLLILVNVAATALVEKFPLKLDLTSEKLYEISEASDRALEGVTSPVTVYLLMSESQMNDKLDARLTQFLKNYDQRYDNIDVQFVDIYENPSFANKYSSEGLTATSVIVESAYRYKIFSVYNMYGQDSNGNITSFYGERQLTNAVLYVTRETIPVIRFTEGHGESVPTVFRQLCLDANFSVEKIALADEDPTEETNALVIFAPTRDFTDDEVNKIAAFVQNRGNLMVFLDPSTPALPNLEELMAEYGVAYGEGLVADPDRYTLSSVQNLVPHYGDAENVTELKAKNLNTVAPQARPIVKLFDESGYRKIQSVLTTSGNAYTKTGEYDSLQYAEGDAKGPFDVMTLTMDVRYNADNEREICYVLASGSTVFANDSLLSTSSYGNADILVKTLGLFSYEAPTEIIPGKFYSNTVLSMTSGQIAVCFWLFVVIVPALLLGGGIFVWARRRHL